MEPVLHGRESALRALRAGLESAIGGHGRLALVSGEAGIGKSAVCAAIGRDAEARGAVVTWGRAWEFADAPPYFPVWPCLRVLGIDIGAGVNWPSHEKQGEGNAFQLWEKVVTSLARASSSVARVWILEDMHAADLGTLDLLTFLAQPLRAMHVLVIATVRSEDPRVTERMAQRLTRMARDGLDVRLETLSDRDVAALTAEIVGRAVPESALGRLVELTGGNPLFVVECARAFRDAEGSEATLGSLPPTVRQVVLDRVALLPESTGRTLACAAVLGREFSAALVARMGQSPPARAIDALLPALRAGVVRETRPGQFIFSHTLVRDAIEDALGGEERADLHARAEVALGALGDTADVLVERARHALSGLQPGNENHALAIADRATELLENEGAFDRAFELHARIGEARGAGLFPPALPGKTLHIARIAREAGRSDVSRRLCEEVMASARATGDAELFARAALLHCTDVRPSVVDRQQVALLGQARALLGDRSPELGCRVLARLATAVQPSPDPAVPMAMALEAIQRARATSDASLILDVLELAGWGMYFAPLSARIDWSTELLERALQVNDLRRALTAYAWLAFHRVEMGDFDAFDRDTASMLALSDEIGHPRHRWRALLLASAQAMTLGHFTESDRYVTEVAELAALIDDPAIALSLVTHDVMRGNVLRRDPEQQRAVMAKLEHVMDGVPDAPLVRAILRAACSARIEDVETTRAELAVIGSARAPAFHDVHPAFVAALAEAYALAGTPDDRRRIRDVLLRLEIRDITGGHVSFTYEGTVPRLLGLLDAALGDFEAAETELREAHTLAVERRHLPWIAQTAYELAKVLRRDGREEEARALSEECSRIAQKLGMSGLEGSVKARPSPSTPASAAVTLTIERDGERWRVVRGAAAVKVRDSRGMQLLAKLVERAHEEVHVLALASDEATAVPESSAGEMLDDRARQAYRQRLADLEEDIAEAERHADIGRRMKLEHERDALVGELSRAVGLGGRVRRAGSATERARVNVQRRVKDAIARIRETDEELGRFFERAVRKGTFCCFRP